MNSFSLLNNYCTLSLIGNFIGLEILLSIGFVPMNKDYVKQNKALLMTPVILITFSIACIFSLNISALPSKSLSSIIFLLFMLAAFFLIYVLAVLISAIVMYSRHKKPVSELNFACFSRIIKRAEFNIESRNEKESAFSKRIRIILIPAASLCYMVTVFGVCESYFANLSDWKFTFTDFALPSLLFFVCLTLFFTIVGAMVLQYDDCKLFSALLSALCVISYIQNAALNDNRILDGSEINEYFCFGTVGIFNFLIWTSLCVGVVLLCVKYRKFCLYTSGAAGLLMIMQIVPLIVMLIQAPDKSLKPSEQVMYNLDGSKQYEISSEENVIVLIMDTFSMEDARKVIANDTSMCSELSDFIFFDNISTETFYTAFSMPSLLTAHELEYSISLLDAYKNCWNSSNADTFYSIMHSNGYDVRLYTDTAAYCGGAENMVDKIDNIDNVSFVYTSEKVKTYFAMLKLSMYKYVPNFLKPVFMIGGEKEVNRFTHVPAAYDADYSDWYNLSFNSSIYGISVFNHDLYNGIQNHCIVSDDRKICTFIHAWGMHEPYYLDSQWQQGTKDDASNLCMKIVTAYVEKFKEIGVYDNSTIIVTADHGVHYINGCAPAMLIKPKGHTSNSITRNSAPGVLQTDLLPTILDSIGQDSTRIGTSLFKLDENASRERFVLDFTTKYQFPLCPKITALGNASYNCYDKYLLQGQVDDYEALEYEGCYPITDYWW